MKLFSANVLRKMVQKVSAADIVETASNSSIESDVTENVMLANRAHRKGPNSAAQQKGPNGNGSSDRCCIDGKPFYISRQEIHHKANEIIDKHFDRNFSIKEVCSINETSYHRWISEKVQQQKTVDTKGVTDAAETDAVSEHSSQKSPKPVTHRARRRRILRARQNPTLNRLAGYMYGRFSKPRPTRCAVRDRFGIPLPTIDRATKHQQKQKIQENVLRRVRLAQMGYHQPPAKEDSSDDESVQNVKRLALLRTPYFLLPTIRISQVKRKERFRNQFLQKDRLNRINLLLYEHHKKGRSSRSGKATVKRNAKVHFDQGKAKRFNFLSKCLFLKCGRKAATTTDNNPMKLKYNAIIQTKYKEQIKNCASNVMCVCPFRFFGLFVCVGLKRAAFRTVDRQGAVVR